MAVAEATQAFVAQQTQIALNATADARIIAGTRTQSANIVIATQTAYAQAVLNAQAQQTVQAEGALTAYPLTATPLAVTQAALLMQQYDQERQSFEDQVVAPLMPVVVILVLLLLILELFGLPPLCSAQWAVSS